MGANGVKCRSRLAILGRNVTEEASVIDLRRKMMGAVACRTGVPPTRYR